MPDPTWLVLEVSRDRCFLYRYTDSGEGAGDTWHQSLEDAYHQAHFEYDLEWEDWVEVPPSAVDAIQFARGHFAGPP
jgi:hypothetical protein